MKKPLFSVVIPVYNKERHVAESINSVLSQTFCDFELIVIDDSSADNSMSEIMRFSDERLRVLKRTTPGPGGYAARNLGISSSLGEWICFLDADDTWTADHLQSKKNLIEIYPDYDLFSCDWQVEGVKEKSLGEAFFKGRSEVLMTPNDYLKSCIDGRRPIHTNVICARRDLLTGMEVFPEGKTDRTGDVHTWARLVLSSSGLVVGSFSGAQRNLGTDNRVSGNSKPNPDFFYRGFLVAPKIDVDQRLLAIYKNRLFGYTLKESGFKGGVSAGKVFRMNYKNDFFFSFKILVLAMLPSVAFRFLRDVKRSVAR